MLRSTPTRPLPGAVACLLRIVLLVGTMLSALPRHAAGAPAGAAADLLVWGLDAQEQPWTFWIAREPSGPRLVAARPGIVLSVRGALWRWTTTAGSAPALFECDVLGVSSGPGTGTVTEARLEPVGGPAGVPAQLVVAAPREAAAQANEYSHQVTLDGSVGPHLFVSDSAYVYDCGAHGNVAWSFRVWNAERGRAEDLRAAVPRAERRALAERARRALAQQFSDDPADAMERVEARDVRPTRLAPIFGADGALALDHAYATDTCYACGDGEWDSYTRSAHVASAVLPPALRAFARVGEIAWLARTRPGLQVRGVGEAAPALRAAFEALPAGSDRR